MSTTLHPEVLWAQRSSDSEAEKNVVYVTINLPDIVEPSLKFDLTSTGFTFAATTGNPSNGVPERHFAIEVPFYAAIDVENSKKNLTSRSLSLILRKAETKLEYWPRLTKDKLRGSTIKTDFDKWVDEDEQNTIVEIPDAEDLGAGGGFGGGGPGGPPGAGGFDPSMLAGLGGGAGGAPDMASMMAQMGGGGAGGQPDFAKMMASMGGGAGGKLGDDDEDDDDDDDAPPPLEDTDK